MSEDSDKSLEINQAISILAQEVQKTNERLKQMETASRGEPVQQEQGQNQSDAFHAPLTLKTLLDELPNIINIARQTGVISNPPSDPLINYKVAIGEKALERVFEDLNKTLFNKEERKGVSDLVPHTTGVQ
jgi:hypothetical protein|tara:strand:+ start:260 stop:652 length:393 start_codon:yes stop_codon:yes gene_type:complete